MKETISYKHSGNCGDLIFSLSCIRQRYYDTDCKADIYLHLNQPSTFTDATHPVGNVMLNQTMYDMVRPLLLEQEYVNSVEVYDNQEIDYNLDLFRLECKNLSAGDIKLWHTIPYPELRCATHNQVLWADKMVSGCEYVVINRSSRYNNPLIDYTQIAELGMNMYFVGVEREYEVMKAICPEVEYYPVKDFKQMAELIAGCEYFFGNQSMAFAIAEQMKVKRVLEQYYGCPNVIPNGGEWYTYQTNEQLNRIILTIKEKCRQK